MEEPLYTPVKQCRSCKKFRAATTEFFHKTALYQSPDGLCKQCKKCCKQYRDERNKNKSAEKIIKPKSEKKWCPGCEQEWPATLDYFNYDKAKGDRLTYYCKQCSNKKNKTYRARPDGKEARQEYRQKNRKRDIAYAKSYHMQHREHERQYQKHYRTTDNYRQSQRTYKSTEKARTKKRIGTLHRIALKKSVPGTYTVAQIAEQLKRQHYHCYYAACGHAKFEKRHGKYVYEIEHTYPLSRVIGTGIPANDMGYIVLACPSCNDSKGTKFPWEWVEGGRLL